MYPISSLLHPWGALANQDATSIKRAFELISDCIADNYSNLSNRSLFLGLWQREQLGATGVGYGAAIPHCRLKRCTHPIAVLLKLNQGIENFSDIDDLPVDLIFTLIVPQEAHQAHLDALKTLATMLNDGDYRDRLRSMKTNDSLYKAAIQQLDTS